MYQIPIVTRNTDILWHGHNNIDEVISVASRDRGESRPHRDCMVVKGVGKSVCVVPVTPALPQKAAYLHRPAALDCRT